MFTAFVTCCSACVTLYSKLLTLQALCLLLFACCVAACVTLYIVKHTLQALFNKQTGKNKNAHNTLLLRYFAAANTLTHAAQNNAIAAHNTAHTRI